MTNQITSYVLYQHDDTGYGSSAVHAIWTYHVGNRTRKAAYQAARRALRRMGPAI